MSQIHDKYMNEEKKKAIEVDEIIQSRFEFIKRQYPHIREAYNNHYEWPELDPLRDEICLCIMFGLCQAAITLTNHLFESLLKYALIISDGKKNKQKEEEIKGRVVSSVEEKYEEGINQYSDLNLSDTINRACTLGLITKKQKKQLHVFRNKFRNAYGHSDKQKTFGKSTMSVTGVKLENEKFKVDEKLEPEISKFLIGQGIVQAMTAQSDAPKYFKYIDSITREIREKLFGPIDQDLAQ